MIRCIWKMLLKSKLFLVRVSLLFLVIELLKCGESSGQMYKAFGFQSNNIGKSQRVRNDA